MKIGIITFHWATNFGAVLQAYALQQCLAKAGHDVEIIDYRPARTMFLQALDRVRHGRFSEFAREARLREFRRSHLCMTRRTYRSNASLHQLQTGFDAFVCGSDQVWNESFIRHAERRPPTLSYYLDFVPDDSARVSYAASFGTEQLTTATATLVQPLLSRFSALSVREDTGSAILERMGLEAEVVVDPTLLLTRPSYDCLIPEGEHGLSTSVYSYVLHGGQSLVHQVDTSVRSLYGNEQELSARASAPSGMAEWLRAIRDAQIVVTNSFHGVVMSIVFRTPFIAVPVEGSSMNDRLSTLLGRLGLDQRIVTCVDEGEIRRLCQEKIDWDDVDSRVAHLRMNAIKFMDSALSGGRS